MGQVIIQEETTKNPLQLIGKEAGICWNADTTDKEKNIQRAKDCLDSGHGRTFEFPSVYMTLDGYSARVIREFYTHIAGGPTRLQSSTRYIKYGNFDYVIPRSVLINQEAMDKYQWLMNQISDTYKDLIALNIPNEDISMILPLGMTTIVVVKMNLRNLIDMSRTRECNRAYWEFRILFKDIKKALSKYSEEWKYLINNCFYPKCMEYGFCPEKYPCGMKHFTKKLN
jgi:thymidylate synthase (FAD)